MLLLLPHHSSSSGSGLEVPSIMSGAVQYVQEEYRGELPSFLVTLSVDDERLNVAGVAAVAAVRAREATGEGMVLRDAVLLRCNSGMLGAGTANEPLCMNTWKNMLIQGTRPDGETICSSNFVWLSMRVDMAPQPDAVHHVGKDVARIVSAYKEPLPTYTGYGVTRSGSLYRFTRAGISVFHR